MKLRLTKQFSFEMAHALPDYLGKCHNIHGHSYKLFVTVEGEPAGTTDETGIHQQTGEASMGMVIDFHQLKTIVEEAIVDRFDHALVLPRKEGDTSQSPDNLGGYQAKLILVDFPPTTENLLIHFAQLLEGRLPEGTRLYSIKLYETETSCGELIL